MIKLILGRICLQEYYEEGIWTKFCELSEKGKNYEKEKERKSKIHFENYVFVGVCAVICFKIQYEWVCDRNRVRT